MTNKKGVMRKELKLARMVAEMARRNLQTAAPELIAYWEGELLSALAEVRRLQRELTS